MRLSAPDRRDSILDAARSLFSRQGFNGTTTKQIAALAGINEALIYRHFPNKEDLYGAVLEVGCARRKDIIRNMLAAEPDDRVAFAMLARDILERRFRDPSLLRLLLYSSLEGHELSHRFFRSHISGVFQVLAERISLRIKQGRFREMDPLLAARGFIGMLIYHFMVQELFGGKKLRDYDLSEVAHSLSAIWLDGMSATVPVPTAKNGSRRAHPRKQAVLPRRAASKISKRIPTGAR